MAGERGRRWHGSRSASGTGARSCPGTFRAAVTAEMGQAFSPPYQVPIVVAVNCLLVAGAWFLLRCWPSLSGCVALTCGVAVAVAVWVLGRRADT